MHKNRWFYLALMVVVVLAMVAGCQPAAQAPEPTTAATQAPTVAPTTAPAATGPTIDRIKQAGKLVVLVDATFRPMEFKDEKGDIVGFDVDLAEEFAKSLGVELELQNINWDGIFVALKQGKGDIIMSSVTITEDRKKEMAFSEPYYLAGQVIIVPADDTTIKGPDDLAGKKVAVQIDTTGQEAAEKIEGITLTKFDGGAEALLAVEQNKVDATVIDAMPGLDFVKNHPKVKAADKKPFTTEELGAAFNQDATDLVKAFNDFMAAAKKDGRYDTTLDKWGL